MVPREETANPSLRPFSRAFPLSRCHSLLNFLCFARLCSLNSPWLPSFPSLSLCVSFWISISFFLPLYLVLPLSLSLSPSLPLASRVSSDWKRLSRINSNPSSSMTVKPLSSLLRLLTLIHFTTLHSLLQRKTRFKRWAVNSTCLICMYVCFFNLFIHTSINWYCGFRADYYVKTNKA